MVREAEEKDLVATAQMAVVMWDSNSVEDLMSEFESDCELSNMDSFAFHMSMGFEEANRIICFTKKF